MNTGFTQQNINTYVPVSLCIVSNQLNERLREIVRVTAGYFPETLIGYNGHPGDIPEDFKAMSKVKMVPVLWEGYSVTKNKLAAAAKHQWILSLDGDEVPEPALLRAMLQLSYPGHPAGPVYALKRISYFEGKRITHGAWGRDRVLRLYHKGYTQWNNDMVHETLTLHPDTEIVQLDGLLQHYTADDYETFLRKNKQYARLSADKYFIRGKKSPLWKRILSPGFTFIREYIFLAGFMDGKAGFKIARINASYTRWKYAFLKEKYQGSSSS